MLLNAANSKWLVHRASEFFTLTASIGNWVLALQTCGQVIPGSLNGLEAGRDCAKASTVQTWLRRMFLMPEINLDNCPRSRHLSLRALSILVLSLPWARLKLFLYWSKRPSRFDSTAFWHLSSKAPKSWELSRLRSPKPVRLSSSKLVRKRSFLAFWKKSPEKSKSQNLFDFLTFCEKSKSRQLFDFVTFCEKSKTFWLLDFLRKVLQFSRCAITGERSA